MSKKTNDKKETKTESFSLEDSLSCVNEYLLPGFLEFIKDEKISTQKQFDKFYNDYKEFR